MARQRPDEEAAAAFEDGRVSTVVKVESGQLVEADHAIEAVADGGRETSREIQVDPVVGVGANRKQLDPAWRPVKRPAILGGEDRDGVAAPGQDAGKPHAIALQPAFRKK